MRRVLSFVIIFAATLIFSTAPASAENYPATLDNGNLVIVDGGMGVGYYADRSSVQVDQYQPPNYMISIDIVPVAFSEDYWRQHGTYIGGPYEIGEAFKETFRYNWDRKVIAHEIDGVWHDWDINRDYSHAEGNPMIPNAAEVAFVSAYNMTFFGDKTNVKGYRVIGESLYRALGI